MRKVILSAILLAAVASVGFYTLTPASLTAARDDRPATFAERFAPAMGHAAKH
ncbi:MAG TPA: hypothetical protein VK734_15730 [Bradyrhizobium sp.]|jgi:hypothetical protein|nr:hypothetical protein [Bradyrhizobium sp.]